LTGQCPDSYIASRLFNLRKTELSSGLINMYPLFGHDFFYMPNSAAPVFFKKHQKMQPAARLAAKGNTVTS
jgi:hypothetical protein